MNTSVRLCGSYIPSQSENTVVSHSSGPFLSSLSPKCVDITILVKVEKGSGFELKEQALIIVSHETCCLLFSVDIVQPKH